MSDEAMAKGDYLDLGACKIMLNLETGQIEPMCGGEWLNALGKKLASDIKGARGVPLVGTFQQEVTDAAALTAWPPAVGPAPVAPAATEGGVSGGSENVQR